MAISRVALEELRILRSPIVPSINEETTNKGTEKKISSRPSEKGLCKNRKLKSIITFDKRMEGDGSSSPQVTGLHQGTICCGKEKKNPFYVSLISVSCDLVD